MKTRINKTLYYCCISYILATLFGCAPTPTYKQPIGDDVATITFRIPPPAETLFSIVSSPTIYFYKNERCEPHESGDVVGHLTNEKGFTKILEKTVNIPSDRRIFIGLVHGTAGSMYTLSCNQLVSFVPEADKSYESFFSVTQQKDGKLVCTSKLKRTDSIPISDIKWHDISCK